VFKPTLSELKIEKKKRHRKNRKKKCEVGSEGKVPCNGDVVTKSVISKSVNIQRK
jgi:hypothetical protein